MNCFDQLQDVLARFLKRELKFLEGFKRFESWLYGLALCFESASSRLPSQAEIEREIKFFKAVAQRKRERSMFEKTIKKRVEHYLRARKARQDLKISEQAEGSSITSELVYAGRKCYEKPVRRGCAPSRVFIDQLSFVFEIQEYLSARDDETLSSRSAFIAQCLDDNGDWDEEKSLQRNAKFIGEDLLAIFGFEEMHRRDKGLNGYKHSFQLGSEPKAFGQTQVNYGYVMLGGNNGTLCVSLTATGLTAALDGWEKRLYCFAARLGSSFRLTRIDLARDFFQGEYNIERMLKDYEAGGFMLHNMQPRCDKVGLDWHNSDTASGRTFYVGSRKNSSRLVRGYEKGKQLKDAFSPWFRVEVEYRRRDLLLPIDMLIHPTDYFCEYPALKQALKETCAPKKIERIKRTFQISYKKAKEHYARQVGRFVNFLIDIGKSGDEIVMILKGKIKSGLYPKRLDVRNYCAQPHLLKSQALNG